MFNNIFEFNVIMDKKWISTKFIYRRVSYLIPPVLKRYLVASVTL